MATDLEEEKLDTAQESGGSVSQAGKSKPAVLIVGGDGKSLFGKFVQVLSISVDGKDPGKADSFNVITGSRVRIYGNGFGLFDSVRVRTEDRKTAVIEEVFVVEKELNFVIPSSFKKIFKTDENLWLELFNNQEPNIKVKLSRNLVYDSKAQEEKDIKENSKKDEASKNSSSGRNTQAGPIGIGKFAENVVLDVSKGVSGQFNSSKSQTANPKASLATNKAKVSSSGQRFQASSNLTAKQLNDLEQDFEVNQETNIAGANLEQVEKNQFNVSQNTTVSSILSGPGTEEFLVTKPGLAVNVNEVSESVSSNASLEQDVSVSGTVKPDVSPSISTQTSVKSQSVINSAEEDTGSVNTQVQAGVQAESSENIHFQNQATAGQDISVAGSVSKPVVSQSGESEIAKQETAESKTKNPALAEIDSLQNASIEANVGNQVSNKNEPAILGETSKPIAGKLDEKQKSKQDQKDSKSIASEGASKKNKSKQPSENISAQQTEKDKEVLQQPEKLEERKNIQGVERAGLDSISVKPSVVNSTASLGTDDKKSIAQNNPKLNLNPQVAENETKQQVVAEPLDSKFKDIKNRLNANDAVLKNAKKQRPVLNELNRPKDRPQESGAIQKPKNLGLNNFPEKTLANSSTKSSKINSDTGSKTSSEDGENKQDVLNKSGENILDQNVEPDESNKDLNNDQQEEGLLLDRFVPPVVKQVKRIADKKSDLAKKGLGQASAKVWNYGFAISAATFFSGFDFFVGALIMDAYWIFGHRRDPKLFPLSPWQKMVTIAANLLPFIYALLLLLLILLAGCNSGEITKRIFISMSGGSVSETASGGGICEYLDIGNIKSFVSNQVEPIAPGGLLSTGSWVSAINASVQKFPDVPGCMLRVVIQKESAGQPDVIGCDCAYNGQPQYCPNGKQSNKYFEGFPFDWDHCSYGIGLTQWTIFQKRYAQSPNDFRRWQSLNFPSRTPFGTNFYGVNDFLNPQTSLDLTAEKFSRDLKNKPGDIAGAFAAYVGASSSQAKFVSERMALYNMCINSSQ
jgi:hypothetical protein